VAARARQFQSWQITWQPERLSASFHGRDLFAPVAAMLVTGVVTPPQVGVVTPFKFQNWPDDLARIIYIDRYGNLMTGIQAASISPDALIQVGDLILRQARTFSDVPVGEGLWYENSSGLVELAINQGNAAARFGVAVGVGVQVTGEYR
jgi:hypothetical protein